MPESLPVAPHLQAVGAQAPESGRENLSDVEITNAHRTSSVVMVAPKFWRMTCLSKSFTECFGNIWHGKDKSASSESAFQPARPVHIGYPPTDQMRFVPMATRNPAQLNFGKQSGKVTLEALDLAELRVAMQDAGEGARRKPSEILTKEEREGFKTYASSFAWSINDHMRESITLPKDVERAHANIKSGLATMKAEGYGRDGLVYKGGAPHHFLGTPAGSVHTVNEYFSTTDHEGVAKSFAYLRHGALIKVFGDDGVDVYSHGPMPRSENEILYPESTSFLVGKKIPHANGNEYPLAITQDRVRGDVKCHAPAFNPTKEHVIALQALTQRLQERLGEDPAFKQLAALLERIEDGLPAAKSSGPIRNMEDNRFSIDDLSPVEHTSLVLRQVNQLVSQLPPHARKAADREMQAIEKALRPLAADWRRLANKASPAKRPAERPAQPAVELPEWARAMFSMEQTVQAHTLPGKSEATLQNQLDSLIENKNLMSRKEYAEQLLEALPCLCDFNSPEDQCEELIGLVEEYLEEAAFHSMDDCVSELKLANALMQQLKKSDRLYNHQSEIMQAISHVAGYSVMSPDEGQLLGNLISVLEDALENLDVALPTVERMLPRLRNMWL